MEYKGATKESHEGNSHAYCMDCMEALKQTPDNYYSLAIVDPPYGIGINHNMGRRKGDKKSNYAPAIWDNESPSVEYFNELFRASKNQIIWGANHFISKMPKDSSCWLMWDKGFSEAVTFAQFELAWTSFNSTCKKYNKHPNLLARIHPTQKPIQLYKWLLQNYGHGGGGRILDTHLGSGSSRIAAYEMGFDFTGFEIDKDYFDAQEKRFQNFIKQLSLFPQ